MMTTFSAMRSLSAQPSVRSAIIGARLARPVHLAHLARCGMLAALALALALGLAGCSALRLAYNNGPQLAWWWVDGYFDFTREQAALVKPAIDQWFEWHRGTQLAGTAALLAGLQAEAGEALTAERACAINDRIRERLEPAIDRALVLSAELLPQLGEAQIRHYERRAAKAIDEMRDEYLQADAAERGRESVKRAIERSEQVYGRLGEAQRKVIADGVEASPFDAEAWLRERERRQRDTAATLRRLIASKADRDTRLAALRALVERSAVSPNTTYREYQRRLVAYNCAFAARIHNATTPAQRAEARARLKGWEDDLRALVAQPAQAPAGGSETQP
jgi:hypothetical protein